MAVLTSWAMKKIGDAMLGKAAFPTVTTMSLALTLASPGAAGSMTSEVSGGSYARQAITSAMSAFSSVTGIASNASAITFPPPTATWGTLLYAVFIDDGNNVWAYQQLGTPFVINSGSSAPQFDIGVLTFTFGSSLTGYAAKKIGDAMLGKAAFPSITTMYHGLFTSNPTIAGTLSSEAVGASYARQSVTAAFGTFDATLGTDTNAISIAYPSPTETWGAIAYVGWVDASTGGNMWAYDQLPSSRSILSGSIAPRFPIGNENFNWS